MSAQRQLDRLRAPITVTYGSEETPEFQRQNRDFAAAVKAAGKPVQLIEAESKLQSLRDGGNSARPSLRTWNGRAALALMKLAPA